MSASDAGSAGAASQVAGSAQAKPSIAPSERPSLGTGRTSSALRLSETALTSAYVRNLLTGKLSALDGAFPSSGAPPGQRTGFDNAEFEF